VTAGRVWSSGGAVGGEWPGVGGGGEPADLVGRLSRDLQYGRTMGVGWIALGAGAGALAVWLTANEAARRRRRFPRYEVWAWAGFLVVAALIYVGFAVFNGASAKWTWTELGGVAGYGLVAWTGAARFPQLVGVGWLLHVLWDVVLHPGGHPGFVPSWYPPLCLGFDVVVGVALVVRFRVTDDAAFWDGIAEKYAKQPVANPDVFDAKIAVTKSRMKATDVVLDIGCGTGSLALRLAGSAAQVHGLDISSEMIRIANGKARAQEVDNVTFHVGPFDETFRAFEAESLDGICAYSLLHLVDDRSAALEQIYRLLKPGGFFISSTVCLGESWVPYGALIGVMRAVGKAPMVKIFDKGTLEGEMRQSGFVEISQPDVGAKADIAFIVAKKPR